MSINVSELTPEQLFQISKQDNFTQLFTSLSDNDKKLFLDKLQSRPVKDITSSVKIRKVNTDEDGNKTTESVKTVEPSPIPNQGEMPGPGVGTMAKNLGKAMVDWGKDGFKMASSEEYDRRMEICRGCEFWKEIPGPIIGRCKKCGCTGAKQKLRSSKCPIGKW